MERDEETGLALHGVRFYAPWLARWASADPAGLGGGLHRYRYSSNSPVSRLDTNGRNDESSLVRDRLRRFEVAAQAVAAETGAAIERTVASAQRGMAALADPAGTAAGLAASSPYGRAAAAGQAAFHEAGGGGAGVLSALGAAALEGEAAFLEPGVASLVEGAGAVPKAHDAVLALPDAGNDILSGDLATARQGVRDFAGGLQAQAGAAEAVLGAGGGVAAARKAGFRFGGQPRPAGMGRVGMGLDPDVLDDALGVGASKAGARPTLPARVGPADDVKLYRGLNPTEAGRADMGAGAYVADGEGVFFALEPSVARPYVQRSGMADVVTVPRGVWDEMVEAGKIVDDPNMVGGGAVIVRPGGVSQMMEASTLQRMKQTSFEFYENFLK